MSPTRLTWLLMLLCASACLGPTSAQPPAPTDSATAAAKVSPAEELIDKAITKLGKLDWLDTRFEHEVRSGGPRLRSTGRMVLARPENKLFYEVEIAAADATASARIVCDGKTIWRVATHGAGTPAVIEYGFDDLQAARNTIDRSQLDPAKIDLLLRDVEEEHGFAAMLPLLRDLREGMTFGELETRTMDHGKSVHVLTGRWKPAVRDKIIEFTLNRHGIKVAQDQKPRVIEAWEKRQEFPLLPRFAKVYLATDTLLPLAMEWYGPLRNDGDDVLLVRLAFTNTEVGKPANAADAAALFALPDELKKTAQKLDPKAIVNARRERLARQEQLLQELNRTRGPEGSGGGRP